MATTTSHPHLFRASQVKEAEESASHPWNPKSFLVARI